MPLADRYQEIFAATDKAQIPRGALTLAWDYVTASDDSSTAHLLAMRDLARPMAEAAMTSTTSLWSPTASSRRT